MQEKIHIVHKWTGNVPPEVYTSDAICITICRYWSNINTGSGVYDWTDIDTDIANIIANGKQFSIKIAAGDKTPAWVFALPVTKLTFTEYVSDNPIPVVIDQPVFWEANYITAWTTFVTALSAHLQADADVWAALSHVSITGINRKTAEYRICAQVLPGSDAVAIWNGAGYTEALILSTQETFNTLFATQFAGKDLAFSMTNYGTTPPFPAISGWTDMNQNAIADLAVYGTRVYGIYTWVKSSFAGAEVTDLAAAAGLSIAGQLSEKEFGDSSTDYAHLNAAMQAAHVAGYKYMEMHDDSLDETIYSYNQYIPQYNLLFSSSNTPDAMAGLVLKSSSCIVPDATYINFNELTGEYGSGNTTGWGAPNPLTTDIITATLKVVIPDSDTLQPTGDVIEIPATGILPFDKTASTFVVTPDMLGLTTDTLPDGAWIINPEYVDASNTYTEDITNKDWILMDATIQGGIQQVNAKQVWVAGVGFTNKVMAANFQLLTAMKVSMWASWNSGDFTEALEMMQEIKAKLLTILK